MLQKYYKQEVTQIPGVTIPTETIRREYNRMTGDNTVGFKQKLRNNEALPMNSFQRLVYDRVTPMGTAYEKNRYDYRVGGYTVDNHPATCKGVFGRYIIVDSAPLLNSVVDGKAVKKLYSNADDADLMALVTAAEAPKTFAMIGATAKRLAGVLKSFKRGDPVGALNALGLGGGKHQRSLNRKANSARRNGTLDKFMSDSWLEVKYGWKPLLQDIEASAKAAADDWSNKPSDVRISGSSKIDLPLSSMSLLANPIVYGGGHVGHVSRYVKYVVFIRVLDPNLRNYNSLGLLNLGEVAWELIPYSFVFDWFAPVGAFIAAQTAFFGTEFSSGCKSWGARQKTEAWIDRYNFDSMFVRETQTYEDHRRTAISGLPDSTKILNSKDFKEDLFNFDKAVTGLALLNGFRR
jgi:hypothetical protein